MPYVVTPDQVAEALARGDTPLWTPNPKQYDALIRMEYEILFGGSRGGGKSSAGIYWLIIGNPLELVKPGEHRPADWTYTNHPQYRALVLRKNQNDLEDWVRKARDIYGLMGAEFHVRPTMFVWPNPANPKEPGATIVIGHLADADAYEKYQGQEFHRLLLEEATQIPKYELYSRVLASVRTVHPELRPQAFLTANPGGCGHSWVRARFVKPIGRDGKLVPAGQTIEWDYDEDAQQWLDLRAMGTTRVFIPALPQDNTVMLERDPLYVARLSSTLAPSPMLRRAWIMGDWDALSGTAFSEFRPNGPITTIAPPEPPNANHVIDGVDLAPWWPRWASCDWGYSHNSAMHVACQHPNGQVHVYKELSRNHLTPEEWGSQVARFLLPDLQGMQSQTLTTWLSHDAFQQRTDERTIADQIASGIEQILGPNTVYIPELADLPRTGTFFSQRELQKTAVVTIRRAERHRVSGWQYMHSLMRWWPLAPPARDSFDVPTALKFLADEGLEKYLAYLHEFDKPEATLPILQIWRACPRLIDAIPKLVQNESDEADPEDCDKTHFDGLDEADSLRYILMAHKLTREREPLQAFFDKRMTGVRRMTSDPNAIMWAARKAESDYEKLGAGEAFSLPHRRRVM